MTLREREFVVAPDRLPVVSGERRREVHAEPGLVLPERAVQALEATQRRGAGQRHPQRDVPEADGCHAAGREVVEPGGVEPVELGRAGAGAAVADPGFGVFGRVLHVALDDPGVEAGAVDPAADAAEGVLSDAVLPVAEQLGDAARVQVGGRPADDRLDERVADHAAVAVLVLGHARRLAA